MRWRRRHVAYEGWVYRLFCRLLVLIYEKARVVLIGLTTCGRVQREITLVEATVTQKLLREGRLLLLVTVGRER